MTPPLILITNDDGIDSPGLQAAAAAAARLGEVLIVAPRHQQTSMGRSHPRPADNTLHTITLLLDGTPHSAYAADLSPAQATMLAVLEVASRPIDLCISGINYGENLGSGVTISGTVGAALEAAGFGIPSLAMSYQTPMEHHLSNSHEVDFSVPGHFTELFARKILEKGLPPGVDILKVDVPAEATTETPWRMASVARRRYYTSYAVKDEQGAVLSIDYRPHLDPDGLDPHSDIYTFGLDRLVAVVPMTYDLTAPIPLNEANDFLS